VSTSATLILAGFWLIVGIPTLDGLALRRELMMPWTDTSWLECDVACSAVRLARGIRGGFRDLVFDDSMPRS
jgi:hypothetical protein